MAQIAPPVRHYAAPAPRRSRRPAVLAPNAEGRKAADPTRRRWAKPRARPSRKAFTPTPSTYLTPGGPSNLPLPPPPRREIDEPPTLPPPRAMLERASSSACSTRRSPARRSRSRSCDARVAAEPAHNQNELTRTRVLHGPTRPACLSRATQRVQSGAGTSVSFVWLDDHLVCSSGPYPEIAQLDRRRGRRRGRSDRCAAARTSTVRARVLADGGARQAGVRARRARGNRSPLHAGDLAGLQRRGALVNHLTARAKNTSLTRGAKPWLWRTASTSFGANGARSPP